MKIPKITIQFFEKDRFNCAVNGGVYLIELLKSGKSSIYLYVGESGSVIKRCGEHLYELFNNPSYLGLIDNDLERNDFILRFSLVKSIKEKKKFWWDKNYKEEELKAIHKYNPITQLPTSDRQISNKVDIVQSEMKKCGFK